MIKSLRFALSPMSLNSRVAQTLKVVDDITADGAVDFNPSESFTQYSKYADYVLVSSMSQASDSFVYSYEFEDIKTSDAASKYFLVLFSKDVEEQFKDYSSYNGINSFDFFNKLYNLALGRETIICDFSTVSRSVLYSYKA